MANMDYKNLVGKKVMFYSLSGMGVVDGFAELREKTEGTIVYVNVPHRWFEIEYADGQLKTAFNFDAIGEDVEVLE